MAAASGVNGGTGGWGSRRGEVPEPVDPMWAGSTQTVATAVESGDAGGGDGMVAELSFGAGGGVEGRGGAGTSDPAGMPRVQGPFSGAKQGGPFPHHLSLAARCMPPPAPRALWLAR